MHPVPQKEIARKWRVNKQGLLCRAREKLTQISLIEIILPNLWTPAQDPSPSPATKLNYIKKPLKPQCPDWKTPVRQSMPRRQQASEYSMEMLKPATDTESEKTMILG